MARLQPEIPTAPTAPHVRSVRGGTATQAVNSIQDQIRRALAPDSDSEDDDVAPPSTIEGMVNDEYARWLSIPALGTKRGVNILSYWSVSGDQNYSIHSSIVVSRTRQCKCNSRRCTPWLWITCPHKHHLCHPNVPSRRLRKQTVLGAIASVQNCLRHYRYSSI